jgi:C4-dicarboxylate-specific signal transduction histidine kinase
MKVLIAEDVTSTRVVVEELLKGWDYTPVPCPDGNTAWEELQKEDGPRIAILDWQMPGLTGSEICQRLEQRKDSRFVYTILLTAKTEVSDKIEGLQAGAHAFISKPCDPKELFTWLKVGERFLRYETLLGEKNRQLQEFANEMEELALERAHQLVHAERMVTLGTMAASIAHEVNNSATIISGNVQILERFWSIIETKLKSTQSTAEEDDQRLPYVLEETPNSIAGILEGIDRITKIVRSLNEFSHNGNEQHRKLCDINVAVQAAIDLCTNARKQFSAIDLDLSNKLPETVVDAQQLQQVFVNIIINAFDALSGVEDPAMKIATEAKNGRVVIVIEDNGPGIEEGLLEKIWDPFFTTKKVGSGTGLGLSVSKGLIKDHAGDYSVENRPEGGARFTIRIPVKTA